MGTKMFDVSESTTRTAEEILKESSELYEKKNDDYADSWRLVGKTIELWLDHLEEDSLELSNEKELNSFGLFTRRLDKMLRAFNIWFCADKTRVNESVVETQEDQIPYAAMHCQLAEEYAAMDYSDFTTEDTR
jgi:hypothetical protein